MSIFICDNFAIFRFEVTNLIFLFYFSAAPDKQGKRKMGPVGVVPFAIATLGDKVEEQKKTMDEEKNETDLQFPLLETLMLAGL